MYEWDERKASANFLRHGVSFDQAEHFDWESALVAEDTRKDYGENRFIAFGLIGNRLHVMVYMPRNGKVRVIGLRKANERERKFYEKCAQTT